MKITEHISGVLSAICLAVLFLIPTSGLAQSSAGPAPTPAPTPIPLPPPVIGDINLDGLVTLAAFGDSITRGVGDFSDPGDEVETASVPSGEAGYPLRVEFELGVPVSNLGKPGERLTDGYRRFAATIPGLAPDIVIIGGGTNDSIGGISSIDFFHSLQTMINIAQASGIQPILITAPPTCCDAPAINSSLDSLNDIIRSLSTINEIPLADIKRAFSNTCRTSSCRLLNRPEGVHPNEDGYDVASEVVIATLLGIDLFAPDGPQLLEAALNAQSGTVRTLPDPF